MESIQPIKLIENPPQTEVYNSTFPFYRTALKAGVTGGILMAVYLLFINGIADGPALGWKFGKFLFIIPILGAALYQYKKSLPAGKIFKEGLKLAMAIGVISVMVLSGINFIATAISPELSFDPFTDKAATLGNVFVNSSILVVEVFIYTMIIAFCWVQYLKDRSSADG